MTLSATVIKTVPLLSLFQMMPVLKKIFNIDLFNSKEKHNTFITHRLKL